MLAFYAAVLCDTETSEAPFPAHVRGALRTAGSGLPTAISTGKHSTKNGKNKLLSCSHTDRRLWMWTTGLILALLCMKRKQTNRSRGSWAILQLNEVGGTVYLHTFVIRMQVPAVCYINMAEGTMLGEGQHTHKTRIHVIASFKRAREKYEHARCFSLFPSRLISCGNRPGALPGGFLLLYQVLDSFTLWPSELPGKQSNPPKKPKPHRYSAVTPNMLLHQSLPLAGGCQSITPAQSETTTASADIQNFTLPLKQPFRLAAELWILTLSPGPPPWTPSTSLDGLWKMHLLSNWFHPKCFPILFFTRALRCFFSWVKPKPPH